MYKPVCIFNVGLPGAGKTTYTRKLIFRDADTPLNLVAVSTDDMIEMIASINGTTYDKEWKDNIAIAEHRAEEGFEYGVLLKMNMIVDRTNLSAKTRKKWLDKLTMDYEKIAIYYHIDDPFKVVRIGKHIPFGTLASMKKRLEIPTAEEGFDLILRTDDMGESFTVLHIREGLQGLARGLGVAV